MNTKTLQKHFSALSLSLEDAPKSAKEALDLLALCCQRASDGLETGFNPNTQTMMEQALAYLMFSYHYANLDLEQVALREMARWQGEGASQKHDRVILVFSDHAELRVDGELRGTIPVYEQADHNELKDIAHLFSCRLEYADHMQLDLFGRAQEKAPPQTSKAPLRP
jgi:hypothetical protein